MIFLSSAKTTYWRGTILLREKLTLMVTIFQYSNINPQKFLLHQEIFSCLNTS